MIYYGFKSIVINAGHLGGLIDSFFKSYKKPDDVEIIVNIEDRTLGTFGCLFTNKSLIKSKDILIVFGDLIFDVNFQHFLDFHLRKKADISIIGRPNDHPQTSDIVEVNTRSRIINIFPKKEIRDAGFLKRNLVPVGIYILKAEVIGRSKNFFLANCRYDFFNDFFPTLLAKKYKLFLYKSTEYIKDIGTEEGFRQAKKDLDSNLPSLLSTLNARPTIFFDCDGVLNQNITPHGLLSHHQLSIIKDAGNAIHKANVNGFLSIAITNKPQMAKGLIDKNELSRIFSKLELEISKDKGFFDDIFWCPHHPEDGFKGEVKSLKKNCFCRKPGIGLFMKALKSHNIDLKNSSIIGDSYRDIEAGKKLGINTYGVETGVGCRDCNSSNFPDILFRDVGQAVDFITNNHQVAKKIASKIKLSSSPYIIAISGQSRTGKSTLAHALFRFYRSDGRNVIHVRLDNWITPFDERGDNTYQQKMGVSSYKNIIDAINKGLSIYAPGYNSLTRKRCNPIKYDFYGKEVIILDGCLSSLKIKKSIHFHIHINDSIELIKQRQISYLKHKNIGDNEIKMIIAERLANEWSCTQSQQEYADLLINNLEFFK